MPFNRSTDLMNRCIVDKAIRSKLNLSEYINVFMFVLLFNRIINQRIINGAVSDI